jgi:hypothetical protein
MLSVKVWSSVAMDTKVMRGLYTSHRKGLLGLEPTDAFADTD